MLLSNRTSVEILQCTYKRVSTHYTLKPIRENILYLFDLRRSLWVLLPKFGSIRVISKKRTTKKRSKTKIIGFPDKTYHMNKSFAATRGRQRTIYFYIYSDV